VPETVAVSVTETVAVSVAETVAVPQSTLGAPGRPFSVHVSTRQKTI
jgi:hypothetical protein